MTIRSEIIWVIALPSFLFLIGILFKGTLEKHKLKELKVDESVLKIFFWEFIYIFSIESVFLIVANGLIITFELEQIIGIALIVVGLIFFLFTSIGSHIRHHFFTFIGIFFTMFLIGAELGYFLFLGLEKFLPSNLLEIFIIGSGIISFILVAKVLLNFDLDDTKAFIRRVRYFISLYWLKKSEQ
jgi:hypothetical protein